MFTLPMAAQTTLGVKDRVPKEVRNTVPGSRLTLTSS